MSRKNIPQIDALVQRTFAQKMWDNGFHPYKDHTEWLRLVDGNILQTVLFHLFHFSHPGRMSTQYVIYIFPYS